MPFAHDLKEKLCTRFFTGTFLLLQILCFLLTLVSGFAVQFGWLIWASEADAVFLLLSSVVFLIAIPFQAGNLVSSLTHSLLSKSPHHLPPTTQFIWSEWMVSALQGGLYAASIMPYMILRQFFGAYDVFGSLEIFGMMFLSGQVLTALAICFSSYCSLFLRIVQWGILVVACTAVFRVLQYGGNFISLMAPSTFFMVFVDSVLLIWVFLEASAGRLSTENHVPAKRLLALLTLGLAPFFVRLGVGAFLAYGSASVVVFFVLLEGFFEPSSSPPMSWRRSLLGRLISPFFLSGWVSISLFSLLVFLISLELLHWERVSREPRLALLFASLFATIIWPAALIRFFLPKSNRFSVLYLLFQVLGTALAFWIYAIPAKVSSFWDVLISLGPLAVFFLNVTKNLPPAGLDIYLWISTILCCLSLFLLLARAFLLRWCQI